VHVLNVIPAKVDIQQLCALRDLRALRGKNHHFYYIDAHFWNHTKF